MQEQLYIAYGPCLCSRCLKAMQRNNKLQIQESSYTQGGRETELGYITDFHCYF